MRLISVLLICGVLLFAAERESGPEAHKYADQVLVPRFVAAWNTWVREHPGDRVGHPWEHCERLDAGDIERWQEVRETFTALDRAMKRAGY